MRQTDVSIDNLTIIAFDAGTLSAYLRFSPYARMVGSRSFIFSKAFKCEDGTFIEVGGENGKVRIEFNPNKANMDEVKAVLERLKYPYLTRMDIAVDYFNYDDFSSIEWSPKRSRKRCRYEDGSGRLETLYIGSNSSHKQHRIYNKMLEKKEKEEAEDLRAETSYWRVEVQKRFKESENIIDYEEYFQDNYFDITPHRKEIDLSHIESVKDRVMIRGFLSAPEELKEVNKNTKTKYNKLIKEVKVKNELLKGETPEELYRKEKSRLARQLISILDNCQNPTQGFTAL